MSLLNKPYKDADKMECYCGCGIVLRADIEKDLGKRMSDYVWFNRKYKDNKCRLKQDNFNTPDKSPEYIPAGQKHYYKPSVYNNYRNE
jgi:hypothetical protein